MRFIAIIRTIGSLRDGVVVSVATTYTVGYVVCSAAAYRNSLGMLPLLDQQYLVAGVPVMMMLALAAALISLARSFVFGLWPRFLARRAPMLQAGLAGVVFIVWMVAVNSGALLSELFPQILLRRIIVFSVILLISLAPQPSALREIMIVRKANGARAGALGMMAGLVEQMSVIRASNLFAVVFLPLLIAALLLQTYVVEIYDRVPQALGGGKARCARLDVNTTMMSSSTAAALGVAIASHAPTRLEQTRKVDVYFVSSQTIIVRCKAYRSGYETIELSRGVIGSVRWCD